MKCFQCGKRFDYRKNSGICPRCGSFNWKEQGEKETGGAATDTGGKGTTAFLIFSIAVFLISAFGVAAFSVLYEEKVEMEFKQEILETEAERKEHVMGEAFSFQDMQLTVEEVRILEEEQGGTPKCPEGMKLAAVRLSGESDGKRTDGNRLSDAYVQYGGGSYRQMENGRFETVYGSWYSLHLFDSCELWDQREGEGWIVFLVDKDTEEFTLCLEERADVNLVVIRAVHAIPVWLEEDLADE